MVIITRFHVYMARSLEMDPLFTEPIILPSHVPARTQYVGFRIHVLICSVRCSYDFIGKGHTRWSEAVFVDVRKIIEAHIPGHLMEEARTSSKHDGRHPDVLWYLVRSPAMKALVEHLCYVVCTAGGGLPAALIFSCDQGRHRSVASAILICLLLVYLGCDVTLEWHTYCSKHGKKHCKAWYCHCHNPIKHNPLICGILLDLWDEVQGIARPIVNTVSALQYLQDSERRVLNTVSALHERGFDIPTGHGYLDPEQDEIVAILYDGIWSVAEQERLWLFVRDSVGVKGWIHRCMVLPFPAG